MSTFGEEEVVSDSKQNLKLERGYAKSSVTRRMRDIKGLMSDMKNVNLVSDKMKSFVVAVNDFYDVHRQYHSSLDDSHELLQSSGYLKLFNSDVNFFNEEVSQWSVVAHGLHEAVASIPQNKVKEDDDSVSSVSSRRSKGSSVASAKAKVAARRAAIMAETAALQERRVLEQEELFLQQKKKEFDLKVELAKADAEERVYSEIEDDNLSHVKTDFIKSWREEASRHSTSPEIYQHGHEVVTEAVIHQNPEPVSAKSTSHITTMKATSQPVRFNPLAEPWQGRHTPQDRADALEGGSVSSERMLHLIYQQQQQQQRLVDTIQLPKAELMKFDGNPLKYWAFIRSFENTVDRQFVDSCAKLTRLLQYCSGKAYKVIQCCSALDPDVGYLKAKNLLKERFGNDYVIAEAWIEKVTDGAVIKSADREALQDFSDELLNCFETLQAMHRLSEIDNQRSLVQIVTKLPYYLQNRWRKVAHKNSKTNGRSHISDVVEFVKSAAEEANDPVFGKIMDNSKDQGSKKFAKRNQTRSSRPINFTVNASNDTVQGPETRKPITARKCPMCEKDHTLFGCDVFKSLSPKERLDFARDKRLCHNCLLPGHFAFRCLKLSNCTVQGCGRKHTRFLHQVKPAMDTYNNQNVSPSNCVMKSNTSEVPANYPNHDQMHNSFVDVESAKCNRTGAGLSSSVTCRIALPIVPVQIHVSNTGKVLETYALLDNGSTNTFCSEELLDELGLHGTTEKLSLTTLEQSNSVCETKVVSLVISDQAAENFVTLPRVYSRPVLPIDTCIMKQEDLQSSTHLQDIEFPHIDERKVTLLIGQDVPEALIPLAVVRGAKGAPYATKTVLGWSLNGPLETISHHKVVSNFIQLDQRLERQVEEFWVIATREHLSKINVLYLSGKILSAKKMGIMSWLFRLSVYLPTC